MCSCTMPSTRSAVTSGVANAFTRPMCFLVLRSTMPITGDFFLSPRSGRPCWPLRFSVICFVHLHRRSLQLHVGFGQQRANLAEHAPSGFVGDSGFALNLFGRDATTSRGHQVHGVIPKAKRSAAVLKDRPSHRRNLRSAVIAGVHRTTLNSIVLALLLALVTVRDVAGESLLHQVLKASRVIGKLAIDDIDRVPEVLRDGLSAIHGKNSMPFLLRDVKG